MSTIDEREVPDLLTRLREAAQPVEIRDGVYGPVAKDGFTPEQVARGLERMRIEGGCGSPGHSSPIQQYCPACWAAMLDAFLEGCKDG